VINLVFANDEVVWVSWKFTAELVPSLRHTTEVIAAYVTPGARIHLYGMSIDSKKMRCIVTDFVIFIQPRNKPDMIVTGDKLGDMTSELKPYEIIPEFASGDPKNYAYTIIDTSNTETAESRLYSPRRNIKLQ
jgi:hypothetical protein